MIQRNGFHNYSFHTSGFSEDSKNGVNPNTVLYVCNLSTQNAEAGDFKFKASLGENLSEGRKGGKEISGYFQIK